MRVQTVWQVVGRTESGDDFSYVFSFPPTREEVDAYLFHNGWEEEYKYVGFTNFSIKRTNVITRAPSKEDISDLKKVRTV